MGKKTQQQQQNIINNRLSWLVTAVTKLEVPEGKTEMYLHDVLRWTINPCFIK